MAVWRGEASLTVAPFHFRLLCVVIVIATVSVTEDDENSVTYVDVCEMYGGFERLTTGVNPDSELVQLHPSTWVYVTKCRHNGRSCKGFGGGRSVCRAKKAWVQVYGRLDDNNAWQPHWIEVDSSCACALRLFPFLTKHPGQ